MNFSLISRLINSRFALIALIAALAVAAAIAGPGLDGSPVYGQTTTDYDDDDDGLIDITTLAQLNVIRLNLNGRGDSGNATYAAAFPGRDTTSGGRMGCPSGQCVGYELRADLDFDTDGDGMSWSGTGSAATGDTGDTYYNSNAGFVPIGTNAAPYATTFKGNGHTISNLFIRITSTTTNNVGLFGEISSAARIESVHLVNPYVRGNGQVGALVGANRGEVTSSFTSGGQTYSNLNSGGLIGYNYGTVHACWSTTAATSVGGPVGGLLGRMSSGATTSASFSAGAVNHTHASGSSGGFIGTVAGTIENSFWDTNVSGKADDSDTNMPEGKTTAQLQNPTGYTGIFSDWNVSVDGVSGGDDPWDFGLPGEYPALKYGGMDPEDQRPAGDYDRDGDGLIEITALAQLDAVRHDLNGDGAVAAGAATTAYNAAFPNRITATHSRMGCAAGSCSGYELAANLDFDTDRDGATYSGTGNNAASDTGDAYHNSGSGWLPIGDDSGNQYASTFKGNGYVISNLFIRRTGTNDVGLFGALSNRARVESLGLANVFIHGQSNLGAVAGDNYGVIAASWSSGHVRGRTIIGGLVGYNLDLGGSDKGEIIASYSHADTHATPAVANTARVGGLVGFSTGGTQITASYSTGTVISTRAGALGGFVGSSGGTVTNSYWDTTASAVATGGGGTGQTTANLQTPTGYTGIYANWNVNVDGSGGADDPWHFGTSSQYPVLKYGGMDPIIQRGDYDLDDDGLVEIRNLDQLNAMRWDRDGDAVQDAESAANWANYNAAFLNAADSLGCPDTDDAGTEPGPCDGFELVVDLDFDANGDGVVDSKDPYPNWVPIHDPVGGSVNFDATFEGNGRTISNLTINTSHDEVGLFGYISGGEITNFGLPNVDITTSFSSLGAAGALAGNLTGSNAVARSVWATGSVTHTGTGNYATVGGLVGSQSGSSSMYAVWADVDVKSSSPQADVGGLVGFLDGTTRAAYSAGDVASSGNNAETGGFAGRLEEANVAAAYATGAVTRTGTGGGLGGFAGGNSSSTVNNAYWDTATTGLTSSSGGTGKTTAQLQSPTGYEGIYAAWNVDAGDPWDFVDSDTYPVLKYGMDPYFQHGDYDVDDDGLIEIYTLARLNAVRWDLDGDAVQGDASADDWKKYEAAFPNAAASLGCPDTDDAGMDPGPCLGYELAADLDFDTDGDGSTYAGSGADAAGDSGDEYYNGGDGWNPLGTYSAVFKGNGYVVSNLFIKRTGTNHAGLFGSTVGGARIESIGVEDAYVAGNLYVGVLAGENRGTIAASWTSGAVRGAIYVGGLTGYNVKFNPADVGDVIASYSRASAYSTTDAGDDAFAAGLVGSAEGNAGANRRPRIIASYSTGAATAGPSVGEINGLADLGTATVTNSYWDTTASGVTTSDGGTGKTTAELFAPAGYTGIYAGWNVDVDGDGSPDDPWDFRGEHAYPALKYGGMDPEDQRFGDYDQDGDGLIEITTLARLNAIRWDLDGDGDVAAGNAAAYDAAFPDRDDSAGARMGCPSGSCSGYELVADLDFDTDGDGSTYTGTGVTATGDSGDAYYNGGTGWVRIGNDSGSRFEAIFKGNGHVISNLFMNYATIDDIGLFGAIDENARIESLGVENGYVDANRYTGLIAGNNYGVVAASWSSGGIWGKGFVGGAVGFNDGDIIASYSTASVYSEPSSGSNARAGGLVGSTTSGVAASYSTGEVTSTVTGQIGGLIGVVDAGGTVANSYWDSVSSGIASGGGGTAKTTADLQEPTGYTGDFSAWNVDVDGDNTPDDPWDFGKTGAYPALKHGGMDPDYQRRGDFDQDGDGLIEITNLAQLSAVHWDGDGDGLQDGVSVANWAIYTAAFADADPGMGCIDTADADTDPGPCVGFELANSLDFDTDGDGDVDTDDDYPSWSPLSTFTATFDGNGHAIANMTISGAQGQNSNVGLFSLLSGATIKSLGMTDASITATTAARFIGVVAGATSQDTTLRGVYATGSISATGITSTSPYFGGLGGYVQSAILEACWANVDITSNAAGLSAGGLTGRYFPSSGDYVTASYALGDISLTGNNSEVGGLFGTAQVVNVSASFAAGALSNTGTTPETGGIVGNLTGSSNTFTQVYWDTETTGIADDAGDAMPEGKTTETLQAPTDYTGIYSGWNVSTDGVTGADDPWDFGYSTTYPILKLAGVDPYLQYDGDYDADDDGLIEINNLARLNAVRWDTNGDGDQGSVSDADWAKHEKAFPNAAASLGCPDTADADMDPGPCLGYELVADLDFDTDGDGSTYTGTGVAAVGDPDDAYYNLGAGFEPFGSYSAIFKGNGGIVSNLFIKRAARNNTGLFGELTSSGRVESIGVKDAYVYGRQFVGILAGYNNGGTTTSSWTTGEAVASRYVGGLVGYNEVDGDVIASYSRAAVRATHPTSVGYAAGLVGLSSEDQRTTVVASYSTGTVTAANPDIAGLLNIVSGTKVVDSYWDTTSSGVTVSDGGTGLTTAQLETPTGYAGVFANWKVDVDGDGAPDDPWDFRGAGAYPVLKFGGMDPEDQRFGDYDLDGDALIEITNLAQLNAVRWDLNGNAVQDSEDDEFWKEYNAVFPDRDTSSATLMGCPAGGCDGYELINDLDFDTDGDGSTYTGSGATAAGDSGDAYYRGGEGWNPIGRSFTSPYAAAFRGNGHVISNLFIKRANRDYVGLFGAIGGDDGSLESMVVDNAFVHGREFAGALVGGNYGDVAASYTSGYVRGASYVGGLAGGSHNNATITAAYSAAAAHSQPTGANHHVGGLVGHSTAAITASYASGAVTSSASPAPSLGGLVGVNTGTIADSYWDTYSSGVTTGSNGVGKTTAQLQTPAGYAGDFADWNVNVDGETGADDPWDFGGVGAYPALKYGGMDPAYQRRGDFDQDGDGLIEIKTLAHLNAMRWDLDGNGDASNAGYAAAFEDADPGMGCIDTDDPGTAPGPCAGYELVNDLDFDTDGDGATYTGTGADAIGDSGDAYNNNGAGWERIGAVLSEFNTTFRGNGYVISNLFIKRTTTDDQALFGAVGGSGRVESLGVKDAYVYGRDQVGILAGTNYGVIAASWTSGYVRGDEYLGGLIAYNNLDGSSPGDIIAAYSTAAVTTVRTTGSVRLGGLVGQAENASASVVASYFAGTITSASSTGVGGLIGTRANTPITNSYWDTTTSGLTTSAGGAGHATAALQNPAGYDGIYAAWNVDVDGDGITDDPWHFGQAGAYPALKYGGMDPADQHTGDYDKDGDLLIEISTLAQLDAVRHDLDGNGDATEAAYAAAFPGRDTTAARRMGCPGTCEGYELIAHLDFDTDGDGSTYAGTGANAAGDDGDEYYNGGMGFAPIGGEYAAKFKGNGYTVSNLFIKRTAENDVGLFSETGADGRIETMSVADAYVAGNQNVGILVGNNSGTIAASWTDGAVRGLALVGGLTGVNRNNGPGATGHAIAVYSRASVEATAATATAAWAGGLIGNIGATAGARLIAGYSTGAVTAVSGALEVGGLVNRETAATITNSYWDTTTSGQTTGEGSGRTTAQLQAPTGYAGIYADWNVDVDGDGAPDDPWHFGLSTDYPVLKYGGMDPYRQYGDGDYDRDGDGLIEISSHERLNAVRWDLNGDGAQGGASDADWRQHETAFPNAAANLGCSGACSGYELVSNLSLASYPNWEPIGDSTTAYSADFAGNGNTITNLTISRSENADDVGLFGRVASGGVITGVGLEDVIVSTSGAGTSLYVGALAGHFSGTARAVYATGTVSQTGTGTGGYVGGLAGYLPSGATIAASRAGAAVTAAGEEAEAGGLVGRLAGGTIRAAYATGTVTAPGDDAYAGGLAGVLHMGTVDASYAAAVVTAAGTGGTASGAGGSAAGSSPTITATYWDTNASGVADDANTDMPEGKTLIELQTPTGYSGIFANWNVNVDGAGGADDPWDFGGAFVYPVLKYGGMDVALQRAGDFDQDGDGLIEIRTLAQLDAIRWDRDGQGDQDTATPTEWANYNAAFPKADLGMGCPDTDDPDTNPGPCVGYELLNDLDFDTNGNGYTYTGSGSTATSDSGDAYHNDGSGWNPIPSDYTSAFVGNGHVIHNLFIKRNTLNEAGLFRKTNSDGRIESLGIANAYVYGAQQTGILMGENEGNILAVWTSGWVRGSSRVGGLVGRNAAPSGGGSSHITASYSHADVVASANPAFVGGLVGHAASPIGRSNSITASYSTGTVTATTSTTNVGGLIGLANNTTVSAVYWDTATSGTTAAGVQSGASAPVGKTTAQLQGPIGYAGIYAAWNRDLDGDGAADNPWDFGMRGEYPALKYGGMDPAAQRQGDYDKDGDGLIDISTLAQLNAVRHDLDGNGVATAPAYAAAFPNRETRTGALMGCPGPCAGYELTTHLDFDTDGDGATYSGTGASATGDAGDQYYNGGSGWEPIGTDVSTTTRFDTTFNGNGYVISNLFIKRATTSDVGLFGAIDGGGRVESLGVSDAYVNARDYVGILVGSNRGVVSSSWSDGAVLAQRFAGGLVGAVISAAASEEGEITAAYSHASVHAVPASGVNAYAGGLAGVISTTSGNDAQITASYATGTVTSTVAGEIGGLVGGLDGSGATIADSYWDTTTSGITGGHGQGRTTANLKAPKTYSGIYVNWNVNVDRRADSDDDPWDFGGSSDYPVLKYGGMGKYTQRGDYDTDDDGLIEITTLEQLNAMRWDLNGNAVRDSASAADWKRHSAAFHNAIAGFGCPGSCNGYELAGNLTFDGDARYSNWTPVGDAAAGFGASFDGNGYIIHNLNIDAAGGALGLFGATAGGSSITGVGLTDVYIRTTSADDSTLVGALIGSHGGTLRQSYATGSVTQAGDGTGGDYGGLIGSALGSSGVYASWADVYVFPLADGADAGGFVGSALSGSTIRASYAKGSVVAPGDNAYAAAFAGAAEGTVGAAYASGISTATGTGGTAAGFHARGASPTFTAVYWNAARIADDADTDAPEGRTVTQLQSPTDYAGIYADWNDGTLGNVDGTGGADDPWDFGEDDQYPALKIGVQDPYAQRGDYDVDDDGLIEITTLDRLNAIRWDLDGDGVQDATTAADWHRYNLAFPNAAAGMGCPDTAADADSDPGPCVGYELAANLDFDANGDGAVDSDDPYPVWMPVGASVTVPYSASFAGNGMTISNLAINSSVDSVGLFGVLTQASSASVTGVGLPDAVVRVRGAYANAGTLAGNVTAGTIRYSWATGSVTYTGEAATATAFVGGLAGYFAGDLAASWADVDVSSSGGASFVGGLIGLSSNLDITASYAKGDVSATAASSEAGGLTGRASGGAITASYATGAVTSSRLGSSVGGFAGSVSITASAGTTTAITNSYWDTATSGVPDDRDAFSPEGITTANLQTPTGYDGIYANWNVDIDATTGADDPWDFGASNQYPILDVGDMDTDIQPRAAERTPVITAPVQVEIPCAWVAHPSALNRCP